MIWIWFLGVFGINIEWVISVNSKIYGDIDIFYFFYSFGGLGFGLWLGKVVE